MDYDNLRATRGAAANNGSNRGSKHVVGWVSTTSIEIKDLMDVGRRLGYE